MTDFFNYFPQNILKLKYILFIYFLIILFNIMKSEELLCSLQSQDNEFGVVIFNRKMTKRKQTKLISPLIAQIFESRDWKINLVTVMNFNHWNELFQCIETAKCTTLTLTKTIFSDFFFNPLTIPRFSHLIKLDLTGNALFNLENLAFIDAINLQELVLSQNFFICARFLQKMNFPKIQQLHLDHNNLSEINFSRVKLNKSFSILLYEQFTEDITKNQDVAFISKMQPENFKRIGFFDEKRIKQSKAKQILVKKYANLFHIKEYTQDQIQILKLALMFIGAQNGPRNQDEPQQRVNTQ